MYSIDLNRRIVFTCLGLFIESEIMIQMIFKPDVRIYGNMAVYIKLIDGHAVIMHKDGDGYHNCYGFL